MKKYGVDIFIDHKYILRDLREWTKEIINFVKEKCFNFEGFINSLCTSENSKWVDQVTGMQILLKRSIVR